MMINCARPVAVIALCGGLAACSGLNPTIQDNFDYYTWDLDAVREMAPQGSGFTQGLRTGYLDIADREYAALDYTSADHFYRKAVTSAEGLNIQADQVALYAKLQADKVEMMAASRARLIDALDGSGRVKAATAAARAQTSFDCWLENESEGDVKGIDACKSAYEEAIAEVERALATTLDNVYIVFFAWDQWSVSPIAQEILDQVAEDYEDGQAAQVVISGFADTSGSAGYNLDLSERRARTVAATLASLGVPQESLDIEWFGETMLLIPTGDGVREPQNRRVEITFADGS